jgi:hypothetical protein
VRGLGVGRPWAPIPQLIEAGHGIWGTLGHDAEMVGGDLKTVWAREREQGQPFAKAWKVALETVEDRQAREVLKSTRQAWRDGYERRGSKMRALG